METCTSRDDHHMPCGKRGRQIMHLLRIVKRCNSTTTQNAATTQCEFQGTVITFMRFELPGVPSPVPCTATIASPDFTMPSATAFLRALEITSSVPTKEAVNIGTTPRATPNWRTTVGLAVIARIGTAGRYFATVLAV